jgi:hypothetical protein
MTRSGRYWLFFVIVAVGLTLSWSQVARKTQRVLEATPVTYLDVEANCLANVRPCAALAGDHALVLGPVDSGLLLKQTGFAPESIASVEARRTDGDADTEAGVTLPVQAAGDGWLIQVDRPGLTGLQVRLAAQGRVSVAEYRLGAN